MVDDDPDVLKRMERLLRLEGFRDVVCCSDPRDVASIVDRNEVSVMILDLIMAGMPGQKILEETRERHPEIPVIVATAVNDLDSAIDCIRHGAFDYVPKTAETGRLASSIRHALSIRELQRDYSALKDTLLAAKRPESPAFSELMTSDERMQSVLRYVESIAASPKPILIVGESGTGKDSWPRPIHRLSGRMGPFVSLNIAGLDDTMFSDSLFGHRRGAFTSAESDRGGPHRARGGRNPLPRRDRRAIPGLPGEAPAPDRGQALLPSRSRPSQVLERGDRNGDQSRPPDGRRNRRLPARSLLPPADPFRPAAPLRERPGDLPLLLSYFVRQSARRLGRGVPTIPDDSRSSLESYDFPGNVRELESMVFDAMSGLKGGVLGSRASGERSFTGTGVKGLPERSDLGADSTRFSSWERLPSLKQASEELIREAIRRSKGNQGIAADLLGISRSALNKRLKSSKDSETDSCY